MKISKLLKIAGIMILVATGAVAGDNQSASMETDEDWQPRWNRKGELMLPENYHHWVFIGAPLTPHGLNGGTAAFPEFHNVYVHPKVLAIYRRTGEWPEGTIVLKELQLTRAAKFEDGSALEASGRGYFPGKLNGIDIAVKDSNRFADTNDWGFFNFGHHEPPYPEVATVQPKDACAGCHIANAAETDMIFTKFYSPILDAK